MKPERALRTRARWAAVGLLAASAATAAAPARAFEVVGDGIPVPLVALPGDAQRGRAIVADRRVGLCLLCHSGPIPEERFQGNLAPALDGAGRRWSPAQLRLRVADPRRLNPDSLMPAFHRALDGEGAVAARVAPAWRGRPVLDAQQVEDVVAYLGPLR